MSNGKLGLGLLGGAAFLALISSVFVVNQWEIALKLQLGKIVDSEYPPGLHFRYPFIQEVKKFDRRIQTMDARPERFLTSEKKDVIVDSFAKWRITDVALFFRSTGGSIEKANRLLAERINASLRDEFSKRTIKDVVSGERSEIMDLLTKDADDKASEIGLEVVDVRVKRIDLPDEVSGSVYDRMRAERERVAFQLRAQGAEIAEKIRAEADRERVVILANAFKTAEEQRGVGDGKSAEIYANAYEKNAEFYAFYRSLSAYREVFEKSGDVMVLAPDSQFFRFFKDKEGVK